MSLRTQGCLPTTRPWLVKQEQGKQSVLDETLNSFERLTSYSYLLVSLLVECEGQHDRITAERARFGS
jgi:hypothetical protein